MTQLYINIFYRALNKLLSSKDTQYHDDIRLLLEAVFLNNGSIVNFVMNISFAASSICQSSPVTPPTREFISLS